MSSTADQKDVETSPEVQLVRTWRDRKKERQERLQARIDAAGRRKDTPNT